MGGGVDWRARLDEIAAGHGLTPSQFDRLARLVELIAHDEHAPTAVRDPATAVDIHLADSLAGLEVAAVRDAKTIADLGAGAGFPGLPLAVVKRETHVVLVESATRKA